MRITLNATVKPETIARIESRIAEGDARYRGEIIDKAVELYIEKAGKTAAKKSARARG